MRFPLNNFTISQGYHSAHTANDLAAPNGTQIYAPDSGKVILVNNNADGYFGGKYIVIEGNSGYRFYMGHNSSNNVTVGQIVKEGDKIGKVGSTGQATGPHVHFEMSKNGVSVDPSKIIKKGDNMITKMIANCLRRFYTGKDCTEAELKKYVGKVTPDEFRKLVMSWPSFKNDIERAKKGTLDPKDHMPATLRKVFKQPSNKATELKKGLYEVK